MFAKTESPHFNKRILRGATALALAGLLLVAAPQPAHAQYVVTDPGAMAQWAQNFLNQATTWAGQAFSTASDSIGKALQVQGASNIADVAAANARGTAEVAQAMKNQTDHYVNPADSACHHTTAAALAASSALSGAAVAQALAQSQQAKPATPSANAQDMSTECSYFAQTDPSTGDPEANAWNAIHCKPNSSGSKWVRADRTMASLINQNSLSVPPTLVLKNGVYAPLTGQLADQYMPFAAALFYCQHVAASTPPVAAAAKATVEQAGLNQIISEQAATSPAATACYKSLERRMQYGPETKSAFPAQNPSNGIQSRYDEQYQLCVEDNANNELDDDKLATCQQYGRSDAQRAYDQAHIATSVRYKNNVMTTATKDTRIMADLNLKLLEQLSAIHSILEQMAVSTSITGAKSVEVQEAGSVLGVTPTASASLH